MTSIFRLIGLCATVLLLAACDPPRGSKTNPVATASLLAYAAPGTQIFLKNDVNGQSSTVQITAGQAKGARGAYIGADGRAGGFYPGCWGCGGDMVIDEDAYRALWPLESGKRTVFLRTAPNGDKARLVITVAGTERITTEAGTFDTFILDGRLENLSGASYSAQVRAWWAPGPGWVVRARGGDSQGNTLSSEVTKFVLP